MTVDAKAHQAQDGEEAAPSRPPEFVEALAKGLTILETFGAGRSEMTLSEVARAAGLTPAAARRSLITLEHLGYVGHENKRFHLKPKVMGLGSSFYFAARIDELLQPDLRHVVDTHGDASSVASLHGEDVIYIAHYTVQSARRASAVVGARYPAHATSLGHVLLAGLSQDRFEAYLEKADLKALTSRTITSKEVLRDVVAQVHEQAYATTVDQLDYGITALAVPIRGTDGATVGALNSSGYSGLVTPEQLVAERLQTLRGAASHISQNFERFPMLESVLRANN